MLKIEDGLGVSNFKTFTLAIDMTEDEAKMSEMRL